MRLVLFYVFVFENNWWFLSCFLCWISFIDATSFLWIISPAILRLYGSWLAYIYLMYSPFIYYVDEVSLSSLIMIIMCLFKGARDILLAYIFIWYSDLVLNFLIWSSGAVLPMDTILGLEKLFWYDRLEDIC